MDRIKRFVNTPSLRKSIIGYITVFALLAAGLSIATGAACYRVSERIRNAYPVTWEKYYLTNPDGERLGEGAYISTEPLAMSEKDERLTALLDLVPMFAAPVYSAAAILAAAGLFYRNRLKKPLHELELASEKISDKNLEFHIGYDSGDELGRLCRSFEAMRSALADNFSEMWRQVEERKRLNAAFAHDLRTPLTVLKGYGELLQSNGDADVAQTAATMAKHISRLEKYADSMGRLQRLEEVEPQCRNMDAAALAEALYETAALMAARHEKEVIFNNHIKSATVAADMEFVMQVYENLISNAVRYAAAKIEICASAADGRLAISVSDDGPGFSGESIKNAAEPYFTDAADRAEHFGVGLYICRLLCERHGGELLLKNKSVGCAVTAIFQSRGAEGNS